MTDWSGRDFNCTSVSADCHTTVLVHVSVVSSPSSFRGYSHFAGMCMCVRMRTGLIVCVFVLDWDSAVYSSNCVCPSPPQTPFSTQSPPCWSCLTMWSSVWLPAGTTLVLPLKWRTTFRRTSRPLRGVRWRPAALTCSSAGSEGSGPQEGRSVAGLLCWEQFRRASDGWQLHALLEHCSQHSELCSLCQQVEVEEIG